MEQDTYDISSLVGSLVRKVLYALPLALLAAALTYLVGQRLEPVYQATTTVIAVQAALPNAGSTELMTPPLSADAYEAVLESDLIITDTLTFLGANDLDVSDVDQRLISETRDNIDVAITEDTRFRLANLFDISYTSPDPAAAAEVVNALAASLINWDAERAQQNVEQTITTLERQLDALDEEIESLQLMADVSSQEELDNRRVLRAQQQQELFYAQALRNSAPSLLSVIQPATVPLEPVAPKPIRYAALAFIGVMTLALGLLLFFDAVDTRVRTARDVQVAGDLPVLAEITGTRKRGRAVSAERTSIDLLRANLFRETPDESSKVILLTSPEVVPTKTRLATELAESFALSGYRTLLVDLDVANPVAAAPYEFTRDTAPGLEKHLNDPDYPVVQVKLGDKRLSVVSMTAAEQGVAGHLGRSFRKALEAWRQHHDVTIINAGPVLHSADTLTVAPMCSDTVLAVDLKSVNRRGLRQAVEWLRGVGVDNLGAVALHAGALKTPRAGGNRPASAEAKPRVAKSS